MGQYKTGTVDVTNASQIVTGTLTEWLAEVSAGDLFTKVNSGVLYEVASVDSDTQITLNANYAGVTESGVEYLIARDFTPNLTIPYPAKGDIDTPSILKKAFEILDISTVSTTFADANYLRLDGTNDPVTGPVDFGAITASSYGGIAEANLLDKTAFETITAIWNFNRDPFPGWQIETTDPGFVLIETDAAVDEGRWRFIAQNGLFSIQTRTDADAPGTGFFSVARTGTTPDTVNLTATAITLTGAVSATSYGGITEANLLDKSAAETISGDWTHSGRLVTDDSTAVRAGLNVPHGVAPTTPVNGDFWTTTSSAFVRVNGVTQDLLSAGTPSLITVTNEATDTTSFPAFFTAATGELGPKTNAGLTFNASTGNLSSTLIAGIANANLVDKTASETISGSWSFSGADTPPAAGNSKLSANMLHIDGKEALDGNDPWLRINQNNDFVNGIYCGTTTLRTDGFFQVGSGGSTISAPQGGNVTFCASVGDVVIGDNADVRWADATQPWLTLDSTSVGDGFASQGAGISIGESGKFGSAALHLTYNGDGSGYVGMGSVDQTATTGGRPAFGHFDFTYNNYDIKVGGRLFPGTGLGAVQGTGYIRKPTGNYGSIQVDGYAGVSSSTWEGYSIGGRHVFMDNASTSCGIYNDTNNEWIIQCTDNAEVRLYHNGSEKFRTKSDGVDVTGELIFNDENTALREGAGNSIRHATNSGYIDVGPQNATWAHMSTDRANFWFNTGVHINGVPKRYLQGAIPWYADATNASGKITVAASAPIGPAKGDIWFDTS